MTASPTTPAATKVRRTARAVFHPLISALPLVATSRSPPAVGAGAGEGVASCAEERSGEREEDEEQEQRGSAEQ
jgi:hypothetical protein